MRAFGGKVVGGSWYCSEGATWYVFVAMKLFAILTVVHLSIAITQLSLLKLRRLGQGYLMTFVH